MSGPKAPGQVLQPLAAELARDHFPTYQKASEALMAAAGEDKAPALRAGAAELRLLALVGRGADKAAERVATTELEALLADLPSGSEAPAEAARARALLAIASGRSRDVEVALGSEAESPEGKLVMGLRRLRERKFDLAVSVLRAAVAGAPKRMLPLYLHGKALEESGKREEAIAIYNKVLAGNPEHPGAVVALTRLRGGKPQERRQAAEALIAKLAPPAGKASPAELAEAQVLLGEAQLALGRSPEAVAVLTRVMAAFPRNSSGQRALVESLLADGQSADALARLRAADPVLLTSLDGRIAMGAALVANGQVAEGTAQLESASSQASQNPRVPYWLGIAAETRRPADPAAAADHYRRALNIDKVFLPASLRLAALMQKQGKPQEALRLIKDAEKAGAPAEALELAWGQALVDANNPVEAQQVFRRAVDQPELPAARVGLAAALEAAGKPDQAEAELAKAITELKGAAGLRERMADLLYRRGKKEAALTQLEDELAAATSPARCACGYRSWPWSWDSWIAPARNWNWSSRRSGDPEALFTLGRVNEAGDDLGAALRNYKRALAFESSPDLHLTYGRALARNGRDDEALGELAGAGERAIARLERARIFLRRADIDQALAEVESAARIEPDNGRRRFIRGQCLDFRGADDAAIAWRNAVRTDRQAGRGAVSVGPLRDGQGPPEAGPPPLPRGGQQDPGEVNWRADLYFQLGFAEVAAGSRQLGATALQKYLDAAPQDAPSRPEAERELTRLSRR